MDRRRLVAQAGGTRATDRFVKVHQPTVCRSHRCHVGASSHFNAMSSARPPVAIVMDDLAARQSTLNPTIRDSSGIESTTPRITKLITRITAHGCHASTIVVAGCALLAANVPT